jgi:amino acid transporter
MVTISPIAPLTVFGLALTLSGGHALDTILIAMVAMAFTAISYGRMASLYPSAGSAYTYVGRGLNPHLGFLAGWAMLLDYLVIPLFCVTFGSLSAQRLVPQVPYVVWAALIAVSITFLNLMGIRPMARANRILLLIMFSILGAFIVLAIRYLYHYQGWKGLFSFQPFYNPSTFNLHLIATGTSFAALTYLGFDSVTTLAEEVENPRRNVLLAALLVCLFTGAFAGLVIYLGQRVWPDYQTFTNIETAFMDVSSRVGGTILFRATAILLVIATVGSGLAAQAGAARLLFGMGRDNVLPQRVFAYLDPKRNTPAFNICLIGLLAFGGSMMMSYELTAEVLNFGAFLGFMGVNLAAISEFYIVGQQGCEKRFFKDALMPALGFLFCLGIWWGLPAPSKIVGGVWFAIGFIYHAIRTRGFQLKPTMLNFGEP